MVPNHGDGVVKDMDQVEDIKALLEDLLQDVMKKELNMDAEKNSTHTIFPLTNIPLIGNKNQKIADEIELESSEESEINATEPSSSKTTSSDSSLVSMETIQKEFLSKPKEGLQRSGSESSSSAETEKPPKNSEESPGKKEKSTNVFKRAFRAVFKRKKSSEKKQDVPEPAKQPPRTYGTIFTDKKDWIALKNQMWGIAPDRPSEYQPKVSFCDEVEVKTFLVEKPMRSYALRVRKVRQK